MSGEPGPTALPVRASSARGRRAFAALAGCFLLSGVAGLIYQVTWTRRFGLIFGTADLAVATVLAVYLGGLGLGAAVAARWTRRLERPLRVFAALELGIAACGVLVPVALVLVRRLEASWFGGVLHPAEAEGGGIVLFHLVTAFAVLAIPTMLMGATLPVLVHASVRRDEELGRRVALLYGINTFGAVIGAVVAGFALLPQVGLARTTWVAVGANVLVAVLASRLTPDPRSSAPMEATTRESRDGLSRVALAAAALAGATALTYEVVWTRLLGHLLGGSVYAFSTMLASFLAGIALGSTVASRWARSRATAAIGLLTAQLAAAVATRISLGVLERVPGWLSGIAFEHQLGPGALAATAALLPGAICLGASFPFAVRLCARGADDAGPATAKVYAWNTVGTVTGALVTGFVVLPRLGFARTLDAAAAVNLLVALGIAFASQRTVGRRIARLGAAAAIALLVVLVARPAAEPWAVLRHVPLPGAGTATDSDAGDAVAYQAVGRSATVLALASENGFELRTNGLPEGTIDHQGLHPGRYLVTPWLGTVGVLARPEAQRVMVIGLGAGTVVLAIPPSVSTIDVVEIEAEVVAANRALAEARGVDPLADPRVRLWINDARSALLRTAARWDVIVSQPSHPWTASGHLYTRELMQLARERLSDGGVFVQWIGLGALDESLLRSLLATFAEVFQHITVVRPPHGSALLLAGSEAPFDWPATVPRALERDGNLAHLRTLASGSTEAVVAAIVLDTAGVATLDSPHRIVDDHNRLQARAARILGRGLGRDRGEALLWPRAPSRTLVDPRLDPVRLAERLIEDGLTARANDLVRAVTDPTGQRRIQALLAAERGDTALAGRLFGDRLRRDPDDPDARAYLLRLGRRSIALGGPADPRLGTLRAHEAAIFEGWRAAHRNDLAALEALDAALAAIRPEGPLESDAIRLRAGWRVARKDPELAREAITLLAPELARRPDPPAVSLAARAAATAGWRAAAAYYLRSLGQDPTATIDAWLDSDVAVTAEPAPR